MSNGKSIRMFLADGTPGGIITAEIMNWTGHVVTAPRSRLADLLNRPELARTGVYVLVGDDPENIGRNLAYIGETDNVKKRLVQHAREEEANGKDFWDRVVAITSKDANLTKGHVRYIESMLLKKAKTVSRFGLVNNNQSPEPCPLPEADCADMAFFIEQICIVLPVLGFDLFRDRPRPATTTLTQEIAQPSISPKFELISTRYALKAEAQEIDGEFVVLAGSRARKEWTNAAHGYKALHQMMIDENRLVPCDDPNQLSFSEDTIFRSPSAASAVVLGRADNGRRSWAVVGTGQSYADWQNSQMTEVSGIE
jgi:hypothetical protein